jgi:tetratricopeptide (TPR) repeat protein
VKLYKDGRYDQAVPLAQRLLGLRQRTVGADHFLTGQALENLAEIFLAKEKLKDAESYYEKAVPIFEKSAPEKGNVIVDR